MSPGDLKLILLAFAAIGVLVLLVTWVQRKLFPDEKVDLT